MKNGIFFHEVYDFIDVGFEWGAVNSVWGEELLGLGCVVELFYEEIGDGVMW